LIATKEWSSQRASMERGNIFIRF